MVAWPNDFLEDKEKNMIKISVVIPAYNEEQHIGKCLASLQKQSYKNKEIIIVDDGSTDETSFIVKKFREVRLVKGKHKGSGLARNLGAQHAKGRILVFVDADMTFNKDYIKNLVKPLEEDSSIVGTTHDYEPATNLESIWSRLWGPVRVEKGKEDAKIIFRAIRKDKFLELGGFDHRYGYADDQTFWIKYRLKPAVAKNTICFHRNPETLEETYKQARWISKSWRYRYRIFEVPIINFITFFAFFLSLPALIFLQSVKKKQKEKNIQLSKILIFYSYKFSGYAHGLFLALLTDETKR